MQKACKTFLAVAGRVLFIGFGVQIVLGIIWLAANFPGFQEFGESALYVEISKSLICDEYEGILYPVLILMARGIEDFFHIPYHYILYLVQIGMAYFAGYRLLHSVGIRKSRMDVWGSLAMLTFPMAMQCHLAILPDSLTTSCLLLELSFSFDILREGRAVRSRQLVKVLAFWLAIALLQPEYLYLGFIPVAVLLLCSKKRILYNGILVMAFVGMITGVEDLTQVTGYYGRAHQSMEMSMASRFAWPHVRQDYEYWPEEVKEYIPWEKAVQLDYYADNMYRILARTLEETVGEEVADELLREIAEIAWQRHGKQLLHDTAWDVVGYTFAPVVLQRQLSGKAYDSYSGRNYDIMRGRTPQLTEYYLNYGCWWFAVGLGIAVLIQLGVFVKRVYELWKRKQHISWNIGKIMSGIIVLSTSVGMVLWYSLRGAGMMDYKKTITVGLLWLLGMLYSSIRSLRIQDET